MSKTYFAEDGNYGNAENMTVVETEDWTDEDWQAIDESLDGERPWIAELISRKHGAKRWQVWYRDYENDSRMPLSYSPTFTSRFDAQTWIDNRTDWDVVVWVEEADFCGKCWETIDNSVMEEVSGRTLCHSCLTHPDGQ